MPETLTESVGVMRPARWAPHATVLACLAYHGSRAVQMSTEYSRAPTCVVAPGRPLLFFENVVLRAAIIDYDSSHAAEI